MKAGEHINLTTGEKKLVLAVVRALIDRDMVAFDAIEKSKFFDKDTFWEWVDIVELKSEDVDQGLFDNALLLRTGRFSEPGWDLLYIGIGGKVGRQPDPYACRAILSFERSHDGKLRLNSIGDTEAGEDDS